MVAAKQNQLGFLLRKSDIRNGVFVPKYYAPEVPARLYALRKTHDLLTLGDLIADGHISIGTGDEIGKMAYGTGDIPFIRTSDISNWELKADAKQGVSKDIYQKYVRKQDVQPGDVLFVRDGTYLIGQSCLVTEYDVPCLYQSHILKFRVRETSPISGALLLACLNTPIVKQQIRACQFTADIIDTIGNRYLEIQLPVPKNDVVARRIAEELKANLEERAVLRERLKKIPLWVEGIITELSDELPVDWTWRGESQGNAGFTLPLSHVQAQVFIPKYYDPKIEKDLSALATTHELVTLREFVKKKALSWNTGIEIGKMAYGTGNIPFIRTSDISNWELKGDPKQNVSEEIYEANRQQVRAEDIFVVRDGTYLVGTSCILTEHDTQILYCGGIYKLRVEDKAKLDPYLLLTLLNSPIVRRQMRSKQFTRDIIDTLGKRIFEVVLPIPKDKRLREKIARETRKVIETRVRLRNRAKQIALEVEGIEIPINGDIEALEEI